MVYLIRFTYNYFTDGFESNRDRRLEHLPQMSSTLPMLACIGVYLLFVLKLGPKWMKNRPPFNLKYIMRAYNAIQVVANFGLLCFGLPSIFHRGYSLTCQPIEFTNTEPWMMRLLYVTYGYYLTKYLDLLDTVFFVLRKKDSHISFLHVYHHAGMIFAVHFHLLFLGGGHSTMIGVVNLLVHTVMYAYYFVTSLKPNSATSVWWKRHITQLQLFQFAYLTLHFAMVFYNNTCGYPLFINFVGFSQNIFMFSLFFDFYYKAYIRSDRRRLRQEPAVAVRASAADGARAEKCS